MPPPHVSVVLPAYRLGPVIAANIRTVLAAMEPVGDYELVVVDDGSEDETQAALASVAADDPRVRVVTHERNRGKGEALVSGWRASRGQVIVFLDADLDLPPEQVPLLTERLEDADVVVGTKRQSMDAGNYPPLRTVLSRLYSSSTSRLFGLPVDETQTGLKLFRREVLDQVIPDMRIMGYAFDLELLVRAHRLGHTIVEAPVELAEAAREASFRIAMAWELGRDALRLAWWAVTGRLSGPSRARKPEEPPAREQ